MPSERLRNSRGRGFNTDLFFQPKVLPRSHPEYMLTMHKSKELAQKQLKGGIQKKSRTGRRRWGETRMGGEEKESRFRRTVKSITQP